MLAIVTMIPVMMLPCLSLVIISVKMVAMASEKAKDRDLTDIFKLASIAWCRWTHERRKVVLGKLILVQLKTFWLLLLSTESAKVFK